MHTQIIKEKENERRERDEMDEALLWSAGGLRMRRGREKRVLL